MNTDDTVERLDEVWWFGRQRASAQISRASGSNEDLRPGKLNGNPAPAGLLRGSASAPNLRDSRTGPPTSSQTSPAKVDAKAPPGVASKPPRPSSGRPPRQEAPARHPARMGNRKLQSFAERRKAWRARLEAVSGTNDNASKEGFPSSSESTTHRLPTAQKEAASGSGTAGGVHRSPTPRVYTVPVPVRSSGPSNGASSNTSRANSVQNTPSSSPKAPSVLGDEAQAHTAKSSPAAMPSGDLHPIPAYWKGCQTSHAPQNLPSLSNEELCVFLQQAGRAQETWPSDHEGLVAAALAARGAWEVERIVIGCGMHPEDVLRVSRDCTDYTALKIAWKKLAMLVHPDKNGAEGAADALQIAHDAFNILTLRTEHETPSASGRVEEQHTVPVKGDGSPASMAPVGPDQERREAPVPVKVRVRLKAAKSEQSLLQRDI